MKTEKISHEIKLMYGRVYQLKTPEENINILKRELFAATLAEIEFETNLEDNLKVMGKDYSFIPLGSFKMRKYMSDIYEGEAF